MNTNFDPRSPSTSYAGSSPGTPLNSIQYSNIPSVGSTGTLNSPMRHSNANPLHRIQKSAGIKRLYTSDWIDGGFAQQANPDMQVPSRPGSTAPSVVSDMSAMSQMTKKSKMSGMSQFSTLTVNTNLTGFTQVYSMQPRRVEIENKKPDLRTPQYIDWMNNLVNTIVNLLQNNNGNKAVDWLKYLCGQPDYSEYFDLPKQEVLNHLFLLIFAEIEKIYKAINPNIEIPEIDGRLSTWILLLCDIYIKNIKPAIKDHALPKEKRMKPVIEAIDHALLKQKRRLIPDLCNLLLPNRKFSLHMVTFLCSLLEERGNYKALIRDSDQKFRVVEKLFVMAEKDFTNASTRAKALYMIRKYICGRNKMESQLIAACYITFVLSLLIKEFEEPVIFHNLKLLAQLLLEKRKLETLDRSSARQQFYEANGVEIVSNLMKTYGSSRVIHACLIVVENFCKHSISRENLVILLPSLFQLYGTNDMEMTGTLSSIVCHIVKNHKEQVLEMDGVGKVLHMLSHLKETDPNKIYQLRHPQYPQPRLVDPKVKKEIEDIHKRIEDIADVCFLTLKLMGNINVDIQINPQFMEQLFCWRRLANEGNPHTFDAGILLLDYLASKIMLRQRVLKMLNCLWWQPHNDYKFKNLMLDVRGGQYQMELSQLLIAVVYKSYENYNTDAAQKTYTNNVIIECCILLEAMCSIGTRTEDRLHVQQVILHLTMDCKHNSQLREPLTLLEQCDKERDFELLTFIGQLVSNYPETVSIFNSPRQLKVVEDLSVNSDADIQNLAGSIRSKIIKFQMMSYQQGFHSLTPQMTPNYDDPIRADIYSDDSDTSPNLNRHYNYH